MTKSFKMTHGTTYHHWAREHRGSYPVHVQKKHHMWNYWSWGARAQHSHKVPKRCQYQDIIYAVVPLSDCMERSLSKRGITRREYKVCLLETRYPCKDRTNLTELKKSTKRKYQNGWCFQTGSFRRNQQAADESSTIDSIESRTKRLCIRDRPAVDDALRDKILQGVGSDLIAPWLTPMDMYNVKQAFRCDWDWGRVWHGGRVSDKSLASQIVVHLLLGKSVEEMVALFGSDIVFAASWYVLPCKEFTRHAHRLKHWKSIKKLDRLT